MEFIGKYIIPIVGQLIVFIVPFIYVVVTGKFVKGLFRAWFLFIAYYASLLILNPLFVPVGVELFDGPELFAAIIIGWFPGFIISGLGLLARDFLLRIRPSLFKTKGKEIIIEKKIGPKAQK